MKKDGLGNPENLPTREEMLHALAERHGEDRQKKFSNAVVAVCGLGGLGSNVSVSLARAGIGKLILIDSDAVDITNLHRQQYGASQIGIPKTDALSAVLAAAAPYVELETHHICVTEENIQELLGSADIICECFDRAEAKALLVNTVLEKLPDKYLVAASGMAGFASANLIRTRRITEHFYLCGDGVSDVADGTGLVSSRVMVCAAHQAHAVLRILSGEYEP